MFIFAFSEGEFSEQLPDVFVALFSEVLRSLSELSARSSSHFATLDE
jgi:hypothetical protein